MGRARTIARRSFLIGSVTILGGVAFRAYFVTRPTPNPLLDGLPEGEAALTPFVKITPEGITLIVPRADVGQGIASTQAMLIAEELDIDPATATLDPGQPHPAYFNGIIAADSLPFPAWEHGAVASTARDLMMNVARLTGAQFTGGSSSTADLHETLRLAGATARETLKAAAAARTGVARADLRTEEGHVVLPDGTRIPYTELAGEAATIEPVTDVTLRPPSDWTRLGKPYRRLDIVAKSTGTQSYGIDVVLPGMLYATVRANPGRGGAMASYSADAALAMRGVRSVVKVNEGLPQIGFALAMAALLLVALKDSLRHDFLAQVFPLSVSIIGLVRQSPLKTRLFRAHDGRVSVFAAGMMAEGMGLKDNLLQLLRT